MKGSDKSSNERKNGCSLLVGTRGSMKFSVIEYSEISREQAEQVAQAIDHTLLAPDATPEQIEAVCDEALKHGFKVRAGSCSIADRGWLMRGYRRSAYMDGTSPEWRSG